MDRFEPEPEARPTLSQVQSFLSHHKRAKLRGTDFVEDMECLAARYKFNAYMKENGGPVFGAGSDDDPLVAGVSTLFMMKTLAFAEDHVLYIDVTHKLN
ncbi:hypothetical protein L917_09010 [Phytophthora nicotianae]|uniref:Uncharacterized protein n=2 Tax=Phytophthora nicotianae TaxID=4792 RepID=V9F583_PHYNI|nr:hypothetical protein F443_09345 [Phytophthora nicotianae P1569]ETL39605.1 hypothetical protein L916_09077 [Phytophthora nicotianae]ETL92726.1 hypothetical protein L917_09010 [Phytophthora nicotianae]